MGKTKINATEAKVSCRTGPKGRLTRIKITLNIQPGLGYDLAVFNEYNMEDGVWCLVSCMCVDTIISHCC